MNFLQNLFSAVGSFFSNASPSADETALTSYKRRRSNDEEDEVVIVDDDSPPKRQRFNKEDRILSDITRRQLLLTSSATQTYPDFVIPKKGGRLRGSCSSKSEENNWFMIDGDDSSLSPSKFKNLYKAPKHVRSPHKRHRAAMSFSSISTSSNMMSVDLTVSPTEADQPKASKESNSRTMGTPQFPSGFPWLSPPNGEMSHGAYERLLGSVISMSAKESMRSPKSVKPKKNITVVDLTDDDDSKTEIPTVDLSNSMGRLHKFNDLSNKSRTLVTPSVIRIDEDKNTPARIKVDRVNSFQKKLEGNRFTNPELISKGSFDHSKTVEQFLQLKSQYERKARCEAESFNATLHDIIEKRLQNHLKITESVLIEEEEEEIVTEKPVLTPQMVAKVQNAQSPSLNPNQVLISKFKLDVKREDFMTLKSLNWLNDAVINFYMDLIVERSGSEKKYPSVYAFSTFFFPSLKNGYERVRRYTRKVDLFSKDLILVPIHLSVHWCLAKIDMKHKEIVYYDSMLSSNTQVLEMLMNYLISEHKDKKKEDFDTRGWTIKNDKDIPTQKNGSDCGVFACTFAEYAARHSKFNFSQTDMPYMRNKMCYEILTGKLLL